jgi:DNA-binding response OmpR family regulator
VVLLANKIMRQEFENITILIVEDDYTHYLLLMEYLAPLGFTLLRATNDVEAWSILIKNDIHLILMDVKLKNCKINGIELSREIKAFFPLLPIIIQTAFIDSINGIDLIKNAYDGYITKPYEMGNFTNKVLKILNK